MTVRRTPHALLVPGGNQISQFVDVRPSRRFEKIVEMASGHDGPSWIGNTSVVPDVEFESLHLHDILSVCQAEGCCADLSGGNTDLLYRKQKQRGKREAIAATVHDQWRFASNAFLYWTRLEAEQRAAARLSGRVLPISVDGLADPGAWSTDVAIPAGVVPPSVFTLGPVKINGTLVQSVKRCSVDNQLEVDEDDFSGETYLTFGGIDTWKPQITIETTDPRHFDTYGCLALTSLSVYFRQLKKNEKLYLDNELKHVKLTATVGMVTAEQITGRKAQTRIVIDLEKADDATDPLAVLIDQTIT